MKRIIASILLVIFFVAISPRGFDVHANTKFWSVQSIDTMKFSRDSARSGLSEEFIDSQIKQIADTGATHAAIDTPYDSEFLPILKQWVNSARKYHLNVWFRGNFSGWEGWFNYPRNLTRAKHLEMTSDFIKNNSDLFEDGDIFTACPECENGGPGDPRINNDTNGFREFIIAEYNASNNAFASINKSVISNYFSMNGDVAKLIMDSNTAAETGGVITIDHYVSTPDKLVNDIAEIANKSNAKIVLGEFGAPIPDINGDLSEQEQADWINDAFIKLSNSPYLIGLNYWTNIGSTTSLWNNDGSPRVASKILTNFYGPKVFKGTLLDNSDAPISNIKINYLTKQTFTNTRGQFEIPYFDSSVNVELDLDSGKYNTTVDKMISSRNKVIVHRNISFLERILTFLRSL
jgi:hypothetical protein